jgi:transposase InsO family protein
MKAYRMLLERHAAAERRRDGRVAVDRSDGRWCSYIFGNGCDNGSPLCRTRDAFARLEIGLLLLTTPLESPQSRGMAEMHAALDVERMSGSCPGGPSPPAAPAWTRKAAGFTQAQL